MVPSGCLIRAPAEPSRASGFELPPTLPASPFAAMIAISTAALGFSVTGTTLSGSAGVRSSNTQMLEGTPRPVQIIPSVLPADWANSTHAFRSFCTILALAQQRTRHSSRRIRNLCARACPDAWCDVRCA